MYCLHCCCPADELQRNIDRLTSELGSTHLEVQQLKEELLALHEHADMETAQVNTCSVSNVCCSKLGIVLCQVHQQVMQLRKAQVVTYSSIHTCVVSRFA
jgi:hypothetical protein